MHKDIETLIEVQVLEQRLKELDAEIQSLPRRIATIETQLRGQQAELERGQNALAATQAERRKIDSQIQDLKGRIERSRSHSAEVKTNQEYRAVLDEIAFSEGEIAKCEERLLALLEEQESREAQARATEQELERTRQQVEAEKAEVQARTERDKDERRQTAGRREAMRVTVEADTLRRFDRVARLRGQAVAEVDRQACGACRVRLRPQFLQEILSRPESIFVCESCGRILYLPAPETSDAEAVASAAPLAGR